MSTPQTPKGGRFVAWSGFLFGSVLSIGGNILFTWMPHPPEGAPDGWMPPADWSPSLWAQIGAAAWSVALLLSVEVMSRVRWPNGWAWLAARYGGISAVALGSAVISYGHLSHVLTEWDYGFGAYIGPLVIDGLMTLCGFAILADGTHDTPGRSAETAPIEAVSATAPTRVAAEAAPAEPEPRTRKAATPAPAVDVCPPSTDSPESDDEAAPQVGDDKVRELVAEGLGRRELAKRLNITPYRARKLLEQLGEQQTEQRPVNGHHLEVTS